MSEVTGEEPTGHTPGYIPPEGPGGTAADQFALGVVLMQMLTGWSCRMLNDFRSTPIEQLGLDTGAAAVRQIITAAARDIS